MGRLEGQVATRVGAESVISWGKRLSDVSAEFPSDPALVFVPESGPEDVRTWRELDMNAWRLAHALAARGVGESALVMLALPNSALLVELFYAVWRLGACTLPVNAALPARESESLLAAAAESGRDVVVVSMTPMGGGARHVLVSDLGDWRRTAPEPMPDRVPCPGKAIGSGGSTGRSKIIVDPGPWARSLDASDLTPVGFRPRYRQLVLGPLYHNAPFGCLTLGLFFQHTVTLMERFRAARALDLIREHQIDWLFLVPTHMKRIAELPEFATADLSSLQAFYHSGASCPAWLKRIWMDRIGPEHVFELYGAAENVGATVIDGREWLDHPGSVGRPQPGTEVKVLDSERREVPLGTVGEIFLRDRVRPDATYTYWGSAPAATSVDGLVSLGDLGWVDEHGYLYLADRRRDLIITGGSNVYAAEVEAVLSQHPAIADVAVLGLPDAEWGHRVHAVIELAPGATLTGTAVRDHCKENLSYYKVPKTVEFIQQMPRDASGKIRRSAMVEERSR